MNRLLLEQLNIDGLRKMARQSGVDTSGTRPIIFERLVDFFAKEGWPEPIALLAPVMEQGDTGAGAGLAIAPTIQSGSNENGQVNKSNLINGNLPSIDKIVRAVVSVLDAKNGQAPSVFGSPRT